MASSKPDEPRPISLAELDDVLARAKAEQWRELTLLSPAGNFSFDKQWSADHIFRLDEPLGQHACKLASLTGLTSLDLHRNNIGDEGARALASLTGQSLPQQHRRRGRPRAGVADGPHFARSQS